MFMNIDFRCIYSCLISYLMSTRSYLLVVPLNVITLCSNSLQSFGLDVLCVFLRFLAFVWSCDSFLEDLLGFMPNLLFVFKILRIYVRVPDCMCMCVTLCEESRTCMTKFESESILVNFLIMDQQEGNNSWIWCIIQERIYSERKFTGISQKL